MAEEKIILQPGVNSLATPTLNSAGWVDGNLIRWYQGFLQTLGGWQKWSTIPIVGIGRSLHPWQDLSNFKYMMVGTSERLQVYTGGVQYDITPITSSASLTNKFSTTISTTAVNVEDTAHGASVGDWVYLQIPLGIGGVVLFGYYQVATVVNSSNYTIASAATATSTVTSGGDTPVFTTSMGSANVTVTLVNHGYLAGQIFTVQYSTAVGGLTIDGEYQVQSVTNADSFVITESAPAGSGASGSENADAEVVDYLLPIGLISTISATGWGAGGWGSGGWGTGTGEVVATILLRIWSLDNFGELGLAVPTNLGVYVFTPPASMGNPAVLVGTAPTANTGMFVAMPQAQVILYGSETGSVQDPLLLRWSDAGSYTDYVATSTNQAGSVRLSRGSRIVGGMQAGQTGIILTDTDFWTMDYQGPPFIYSINMLAQNCGLIAQEAMTSLGKSVYWMSLKGFFQFQNNSVSPMDCPVWDEIFTDLDTDNQDKCLAAANTPFNEIFFFYPSLSGGSMEIDKYVKVTLNNPVLWDFGDLVRTGWVDQSLFGMPIGIDANGYLQQHEMGYDNDGDAQVNQFALSGYTDLSKGDDIVFLDQFIPDMKTLDSSAIYDLSVLGLNYPNDTPVVFGPYEVDTATKLVSKRMRKRQLSFKLEFDGSNFFRIGAIRYRLAPSGRERGS